MTSGDELDGQAERSVEEAALRGDRRAVTALWHCHRRWVAAVLLTYKPRSEDLEDLLQDVAMTMISKIGTVREAGNIRAWLRTVAINIARAAGRSERARPVQRLDHQSPETLNGLHAPAGPRDGGGNGGGGAGPGFNEEAQRVMRLAESLPEGYREPLMLKAVYGMRTRQISTLLDLPEATVDTRVSRARRMLREMAGEHNGSGGTGVSPVLPKQSLCGRDARTTSTSSFLAAP